MKKEPSCYLSQMFSQHIFFYLGGEVGRSRLKNLGGYDFVVLVIKKYCQGLKHPIRFHLPIQGLKISQVSDFGQFFLGNFGSKSLLVVSKKSFFGSPRSGEQAF